MNPDSHAHADVPVLESNWKLFCRRCGYTAITASVASVALMIVGGFVTYTPDVSAIDMQNIYLSRIVWYGTVSIVLQLTAAGMFLLTSRPD